MNKRTFESKQTAEWLTKVTTQDVCDRLISPLGEVAWSESYSLRDLVDAMEEEGAAWALVNAGALWDWGPAYDVGDANHLINVTEVARVWPDGPVATFKCVDVCEGGSGGRAYSLTPEQMAAARLEAGGVLLSEQVSTELDAPELNVVEQLLARS